MSGTLRVPFLSMNILLLLLSLWGSLVAAPIDDLTELVNLNSGTTNILGVEKVLEFAASKLERLGPLQVSLIRTTSPELGSSSSMALGR